MVAEYYCAGHSYFPHNATKVEKNKNLAKAGFEFNFFWKFQIHTCRVLLCWRQLFHYQQQKINWRREQFLTRNKALE